MSGPVALVGSGEFLPVMREIDLQLLDGRPPRAVFLPTAAAEEGEERVRYWLDLGDGHFSSLGVEAVGLAVLTREDAERADLAAAIAGAGLVYLSGGNPGYLAETLRGTRVFAAILETWRAGAALAGCSAGACALSASAPDVRRPGAPRIAGLGVVPQLSVIPHFDRLHQLRPSALEAMLATAPPQTTIVGIDEETALIGGPERFVVAGRQAVWHLRTGESPLELPSGTHVEFTTGTEP